MNSRSPGKKLTPPRIMALGFATLILLGTIFLALPISIHEGKHISIIDAFFTATSAACVTGLVVKDTLNDFTVFGQAVILILVQLGGIGFMTAATWVALLLRRKISLRERLILKEAMNQNDMQGVVRLTRRVLFYALTMEGVAALVFAAYWSNDMPLGRAIYHGIFHSVSLFNNAGFELFGEFRGMTPFVEDVVLNVVSMILIVSGGIGFIVMSELIEYKEKRKLSLHAKIVLSATGILIMLGALVVFVFEYTNIGTLGPLHEGSKVLASFFSSVSLRSSGTNTIDISAMRQGTQFFMMLMMFIGAAPGSTGGGIRITTFVILLGAVVTMMRGREDVVMFRNTIPKEQVYKALTITILAVFVVTIATMILSLTQDAPFLAILFETTSAFGTVGLSMGLTQELTITGKLIIIIIMFLGRLGPLTLAYALQSKVSKELYRYPKGTIYIG
ncbi:TrkH family potassium uptake protein [Paenibacillus koleovorans]|uniref:TrkH family potassium uptake protein n=1 Tax=Paenibacillus koleovorans TaxID=121608 RepID=UPI000FD93F63|nr:TrkH family potassium uptake protein [Paenibacillus koleovorans]